MDSFVWSCICVFVSALLLLIILESSLANSPLKIMVEIKPLEFWSMIFKQKILSILKEYASIHQVHLYLLKVSTEFVLVWNLNLVYIQKSALIISHIPNIFITGLFTGLKLTFKWPDQLHCNPHLPKCRGP